MDCPGQEELQRLCHEKMEASREQSVMAHVDQCEDCQSALRGISNELADSAPALAKLAVAVDSQLLRARLAELKLQRRSPQPSHSRQHEDVQPWIADGESGIGRVEHYELIRCIGRGGMGVVFEARDCELHRSVAIKMMSPSLLIDPSNSKRFLREARAAAAINSPSVVAIYAVSKVRDLPYLSMELVDGESLQQRLAREPELEIDQVVDIARQIAEGLSAAHSRGVIHRDIKPANVLLSAENGEVKITDFGLACRASDDPLTQTGTLLGTPEYLAPEQIDGEAVDQRSDLFSLGSLIYHMCAGRPPFASASLVGTLHKVTTSNPPSLASENPREPPWLSDLVEQLQAKDPEDRIQEASTVAQSLQRCEFVDTKARRTTTKKKRATGIAALVTAALVFAGFAVLSKHYQSNRSHKHVAASASELIQVITSDEGDLIVELASDNPFRLDPIKLSNRSVQIVAAEGRSPRLVFNDTAEDVAISCVDGRLELHGLHLEWLDASDGLIEEEFGDAPLIACDNGKLVIVNCDVIADRRTCVELSKSDVTLIKSGLDARFDAIVCERTADNRLDIVDSAIAADVGIRIADRLDRLTFSGTTFTGGFVMEMEYPVDQRGNVTISSDRSQFDCGKSEVAVNQVPTLAGAKVDLVEGLPFRWESTDEGPADIAVTLFGEEEGTRVLTLAPSRVARQ